MNEQKGKMIDESMRVTRLAPSPTGALHLGNVRTFLINWVMARQNGWRVVLRIEDLDGPRVKAGAAEQSIEDLRWIGLDWDDGPVYQRSEIGPYRDALKRLYARGLIYPCKCSRREIQLAMSAPQDGVGELRYPGTCRPRDSKDQSIVISPQHTPLIQGEGEPPPAVVDWPPAVGDEEVAWRLLVPDEAIEFEDHFAGKQSVNVQRQIGDFVVSTKESLPAYQLAVVVDDARQGVTDIVRGDDLIDSAGRQLWVYRFLKLTPLPRYYHLPLVIGEDGRRLAKRHGDTRLASYRESGVKVERVIGLMGYWSGVCEKRKEMNLGEFVECFTPDRISKKRIVFTQEDDRWLKQEM